MRALLICCFALFVTVDANAGDCRKVGGSVCIDTTPVKNISGLNVTLAEVGGCWRYQDRYECLAPGTVDYCAQLGQCRMRANVVILFKDVI